MNFTPDLTRFLRYIQFKGECAAYQEQNPIRLDYDLAISCRDQLEQQQTEKVEELKKVMPQVPQYALRKRPKVTHKKDGEPTKKFLEWMQLLKEHKKPVTTKELQVVKSYDEPNPNSSDQVKSWLYSLGWEPCTYKYLRDKETGDERKIEQVRKDGELTPSVLALKDKAPSVEILEGLTIIQHRLGIFKGFIEEATLKPCDNCDGTCHGPNGKSENCPSCGGYGSVYYIKATIGGLTNTMRFKHRKPLVNLPGVGREWGKEIRACLMAEDGEVFTGSDLVSLEDTTKRHYMHDYDPDYVKEMSVDTYDPHMKLLVIAGQITQEDYDFYVENKDRYS